MATRQVGSVESRELGIRRGRNEHRKAYEARLARARMRTHAYDRRVAQQNAAIARRLVSTGTNG